MCTRTYYPPKEIVDAVPAVDSYTGGSRCHPPAPARHSVSECRVPKGRVRKRIKAWALSSFPIPNYRKRFSARCVERTLRWDI